jgi:hypothetical protein
MVSMCDWPDTAQTAVFQKSGKQWYSIPASEGIVSEQGGAGAWETEGIGRLGR